MRNYRRRKRGETNNKHRVLYDDVGGVCKLKNELLKTINLIIIIVSTVQFQIDNNLLRKLSN